ncbi:MULTISPECIES: formate dehydrogenase accessory sulfurtransferase FdhD [unclassified Actinobaculum]|uniref:formate dehydrogenase accessory sulfurtransferase FdhD n=1 Tax=unclassified Actinobaculum TaxID=2609299 RepID=UPI000D5269F8|nr:MULTISPECIES: formate dehydrogenase accessory sulfurtransferase FdhD [unclassified Actinobaculum]AWE43180.1 hypothetical protein DDD63_10980 [Actinobaculum sp. 313]
MSQSPTGRRRGAVVDPLYPGRTREIRVPFEEPLELRADGRCLVRLLRTPGHDLELVHGYLLGEGLISGRDDVRSARYCEGRSISEGAGCAENSYNVVSVTVNDAATLAAAGSVTADVGVSSSQWKVPGPATSPQGRVKRAGESSVLQSIASGDGRESPAGPDALDDVAARSGGFDDVVAPVAIREDVTIVEAALLRRIVAKLAQERVYSAASLTLPGISTVRTDIHLGQAVDKAVGWAVLAGLMPLEGAVLGVSGIPDIHVMTRAVRAGLPIVVGMHPPSSSAIDMAAEYGVTLAVVQDAAPEPDVVVLTVADRVEEGPVEGE